MVGVGELGSGLAADFGVFGEPGAVDLERHLVELAVQEPVAQILDILID